MSHLTYALDHQATSRRLVVASSNVLLTATAIPELEFAIQQAIAIGVDERKIEIARAPPAYGGSGTSSRYAHRPLGRRGGGGEWGMWWVRVSGGSLLYFIRRGLCVSYYN